MREVSVFCLELKRETFPWDKDRKGRIMRLGFHSIHHLRFSCWLSFLAIFYVVWIYIVDVWSHKRERLGFYGSGSAIIFFSANRWGARGSVGALIFHCYFLPNKGNWVDLTDLTSRVQWMKVGHYRFFLGGGAETGWGR